MATDQPEVLTLPSFISQVHNHTKLKLISLKAAIFFSIKSKSNLLEWKVSFFNFIFWSYCSFHGYEGNFS